MVGKWRRDKGEGELPQAYTGPKGSKTAATKSPLPRT